MILFSGVRIRSVNTHYVDQYFGKESRYNIYVVNYSRCFI